jgi:hypothetical protein
MASCSSFQFTPMPHRMLDQAWADSIAPIIQGRLEQRLGHKFHLPAIIVVSSAERTATLDSIGFATSRIPSPLATELWRAVGILPPASSLLSGKQQLNHLATRAVYQPTKQRILVFADNDPARLEEALTHEMVHAFQNDRFGISRLLKIPQEEDQVVGMLGALEGEAVHLATSKESDASVLFQPVDPCAVPEGPLWLLTAAIQSRTEFQELPPAVVLPTYAPYVYGPRLACLLEKRYGKAGFDTLMNRPPEGSWQLWNHEDYLANRKPLDWDTSWNLESIPGEWRPFGQMRVGEIRIATLLVQWDRDLAWSLLKGQGLQWRGDRIWVAEHEEKGKAFAWKLAFRTDDAAGNFLKAWWDIQSKRLAFQLPDLVSNDSGSSALWESPDHRAWLVHQRGSEVFVLEGFPSSYSARLLQALRRSKPTEANLR